MADTQFRKIFIANPSFKMQTADLRLRCEELVTFCDSPIFDDLLSDSKDRFEFRIFSALLDFDSDRDAIAIYGDPLIICLAVFWLAGKFDKINILRFSVKKNSYVLKEINENFFPEEFENE